MNSSSDAANDQLPTRHRRRRRAKKHDEAPPDGNEDAEHPSGAPRELGVPRLAACDLVDVYTPDLKRVCINVTVSSLVHFPAHAQRHRDQHPPYVFCIDFDPNLVAISNQHGGGAPPSTPSIHLTTTLVVGTDPLLPHRDPYDTSHVEVGAAASADAMREANGGSDALITGGCLRGSECPFIHANRHTLPPFQLVHVNFLLPSLSDAPYARLSMDFTVTTGVMTVLAPNGRMPGESVPLTHIYVTNGSVRTPDQMKAKPLSHCAHFYFNRICNRGASCLFAHVVRVRRSSVRDPDSDSVLADYRTQSIGEMVLSSACLPSQLASHLAATIFPLAAVPPRRVTPLSLAPLSVSPNAVASAPNTSMEESNVTTLISGLSPGHHPTRGISAESAFLNRHRLSGSSVLSSTSNLASSTSAPVQLPPSIGSSASRLLSLEHFCLDTPDGLDAPRRSRSNTPCRSFRKSSESESAETLAVAGTSENAAMGRAPNATQQQQGSRRAQPPAVPPSSMAIIPGWCSKPVRMGIKTVFSIASPQQRGSVMIPPSLPSPTASIVVSALQMHQTGSDRRRVELVTDGGADVARGPMDAANFLPSDPEMGHEGSATPETDTSHNRGQGGTPIVAPLLFSHFPYGDRLPQ